MGLVDYYWGVKLLRRAGLLGLALFCAVERLGDKPLPGEGNVAATAQAQPRVESGRNSVTRGELETVGWRQVAAVKRPESGLTAQEEGLVRDLIWKERAVPGRRVPELAAERFWMGPELRGVAVPLTEANTLSHLHYLQGHYSCLAGERGETLWLNPEMVLLKFREQELLSVVRVEAGRELEAARMIAKRSDVELAEPDVFRERCFVPNDPLLSSQWHHQTIGSYQAWDYPAVQGGVKVAILDAPFQMDHPDLQAVTVVGWDAVANQPVTNSSGIDHSTLGAGLIAAVANNGVGGAGVSSALVLPINTTGAESELCAGIYWAATNGVRVVNISWTGAGSDAINAAASYLKVRGRGLVFMAGENGTGMTSYGNQPDIWAVSMTDAVDNQRSKYGESIDFAAPGWLVYSTKTQGSFGSSYGTSYSAPVMAGAAAWIMSMNPALGAEEVISILKNTAKDLGDPGWDMWYGWGRVDLGRAAAQAQASLPQAGIISCSASAVVVSSGVPPGVSCQLWRSAVGAVFHWVPMANALVSTNSGVLIFTDTAPLQDGAFYRISLGK
jgi:hypothetical protein